MPDTALRRVAVTGLGAVSSLGIGARAFTESLRAARSGISQISSFDASGFDHTQAGEVHDFQPGEYLKRVTPERWGRRRAAIRPTRAQLGWGGSRPVQQPQRLPGGLLQHCRDGGRGV